MRDSGKTIATERLRASYDAVAEEYYDGYRHPTCANFREASSRILKSWLQRLPRNRGLSCEVGAGASLWAELLARRSESLCGLIATDQSLSMLRHSKRWEPEGLQLIVSRAEELPLRDGGLDLLVSSLGDPYNEPAFWREVSRVLPPGGRSFFTTPSYEWAMAFRVMNAQEETMAAEFELSDGRTVLVPSWIYSPDEQVKLIERFGLTVEEVVHVPRSALMPDRVSAKLLVDGGRDVNIVSGYFVAKGSRSRLLPPS